MRYIAEALKAYLSSHPFQSGCRDSETVLDQLYQVYVCSWIKALAGLSNCIGKK